MLVGCVECLNRIAAADMQHDIAMLQNRRARLHGHRLLALGISAESSLALPAARAFRRNASLRLAVHQEIDNQKQNRSVLLFFLLRVRVAPATVSPRSMLIRGNLPVFALYTDPGAGSMMLQLVLGGLSGLYVYFRIFHQRARNFFLGKPEQHLPEADVAFQSGSLQQGTKIVGEPSSQAASPAQKP